MFLGFFVFYHITKIIAYIGFVPFYAKGTLVRMSEIIIKRYNVSLLEHNSVSGKSLFEILEETNYIIQSLHIWITGNNHIITNNV